MSLRGDASSPRPAARAEGRERSRGPSGAAPRRAREEVLVGQTPGQAPGRDRAGG